MTEKLFCDDNLPMLREYVAADRVDLVYLDPRFNSKANYNVLFRAPNGGQSQSQIEAFDDAGHRSESAESA